MFKGFKMSKSLKTKRKISEIYYACGVCSVHVTKRIFQS